MLEVTLTDSNFPHQTYLTPFMESKKLRWMRDGKRRNINFYTDNFIKKEVIQIPQDGNLNILVMLEPFTNPAWTDIYDYIRTDFEKFDLIITHNLMKLGDLIVMRPDKFHYSTKCCTTSWLEPNMIGIQSKSKMISMPFSWKKISEGHSLRHEIYNKYKDSGLIDFFGTGIEGYEGEFRDCFKDYKYTVVIENGLQHGFNSEKLNDAFLTGSIPLYWGSNIWDKNYNQQSIIHFNPKADTINWNFEETLNNFDILIKKIYDTDPYDKLTPAIESNYNYTLTKLVTEDNIYDILVEKGIV